jgi:HSP20 family protein
MVFAIYLVLADKPEPGRRKGPLDQGKTPGSGLRITLSNKIIGDKIMKTVTLYRPSVLENALSDFDRYMDSFWGDSFLSPSDRIFNRLPAVDVRETDKAYVLEADLPGFEEKDVEVHLDNNTLIIESQKEDEKKEEKKGSYVIRERRSSAFSRSFRLPENADPEGITASFKNGVLSLEIKKRAEAQKRVIQIGKN